MADTEDALNRADDAVRDRGRGRSAEVGTRRGLVGVEIRDAAVLQIRPVRGHVGGRAELADFFGVPARDDDRPLGRPAVAMQFSKTARDFEQRRDAGSVIGDAVHPGVAVAAEHDALLRVASRDLADRIPQRGVIRVHDDAFVHGDAVWPLRMFAISTRALRASIGRVGMRSGRLSSPITSPR